MLNLERRWYRSSHDVVTALLLPLSWLFRFIVASRRFLYRIKFKKSHHFPVPVIVVGNITVGGTGKTPFAIWLAHFLKENGFHPGIVTRGVGGKQQRAPRWVTENSDPSQVGDEAILLANNTQVPVVIGIDRVAAVTELLAKTQCNIVISDDGLQHYRLGRDVEIAIFDGARGFGNKSLLPAGPLREPTSRLQEVDFIVEQVTSILSPYPYISFSDEAEEEARHKKLKEAFIMELVGNELISISDPSQKLPLAHYKNLPVHAVAGIGNPKRFFAFLKAHGLDVVEHAFPDHYLYRQQDFNFGDELPIIMTEKDAVKCKKFADARFWYLPVTMQIDKLFGKMLLDKIALIK